MRPILSFVIVCCLLVVALVPVTELSKDSKQPQSLTVTTNGHGWGG